MNVMSIIKALEARAAWEQLPTVVTHTRDGWAAYKGNVRITKFFFSAESAMNAGIDWDNADVKVEFR